MYMYDLILMIGLYLKLHVSFKCYYPYFCIFHKVYEGSRADNWLDTNGYDNQLIIERVEANLVN